MADFGDITLGDILRARAEEEAARLAAEAEAEAEAEAADAEAAAVAAALAPEPEPPPLPAPAAPIPTDPESWAPRKKTRKNKKREAEAAPEGEYKAPEYIPPTDPRQELAARTLCRRRLLPFVQRFRPAYLAGWVHDDICRRLERFLERVEAGHSPRLLLLCPPRSGKSELSSRHFPAWVLGKHPDWELIAASHSLTLSRSFSRYMRDLIRDPAYNSVFPDAVLDPSSQSIENWNMTAGGGYLAASNGSGITGRGCHILVLDDLLADMEAADSPVQRDALFEWYLSTAYTRLAPGGGVLGLMTHWHEDDWAGRIIAAAEAGGDKFEVVRYPAINEAGDEYIMPDDSIQQITPGLPVPEGARLTRRRGTAIHPERYSTEMMLAIRNNMIHGGQKRVWDALFQQNPLPDEGIYFNKGMIRDYGAAPARDDLFIYQAWDFAITLDTANDYTVGVTIGQDPSDNLYVLDLMRFRSDDGSFIIGTILDFAQKWNAGVLGVEDGHIWKSLMFQFTKECKARRYYPNHEVLRPLTDKLVRANALRGRMQQGKVYFPEEAPWRDELIRELLHFPSGQHDDQVDALAHSVRLTLTRSAPRIRDPQIKKQKSWIDLVRRATHTTRDHMAS
ncbi:MAG: phage terminase large subunit [Bifidobacteriaceae bacterium]|jgi:predicted phage terminase large subunit-like protein|nr:phage terminase large subunit [Bifidobacteriaceae bacterium]